MKKTEPCMPVHYGMVAPQQKDGSDISHVVCRKKGNVSLDFCAECPEFEPAVIGLSEGDVLEKLDGIDPHTGNSYATCKWFGEIVRLDPFWAEVRRLQTQKFGRI